MARRGFRLIIKVRLAILYHHHYHYHRLPHPTPPAAAAACPSHRLKPPLASVLLRLAQGKMSAAGLDVAALDDPAMKVPLQGDNGGVTQVAAKDHPQYVALLKMDAEGFRSKRGFLQVGGEGQQRLLLCPHHTPSAACHSVSRRTPSPACHWARIASRRRS